MSMLKPTAGLSREAMENHLTLLGWYPRTALCRTALEFIDPIAQEAPALGHVESDSGIGVWRDAGASCGYKIAKRWICQKNPNQWSFIPDRTFWILAEYVLGEQDDRADH